MFSPETTPLRKLRNLWVLAAVTYSLVIIVGILSVIAYRRMYPEAGAAEIEREQKWATVSIGSVWLPIYPGAIVQDSAMTTQGDVTEGSMRFLSIDGPAKVVAFYNARLRKTGFQVILRGDSIEARSRNAKQTANIVLIRTEAGSEARITTRAVEKK